MALKNRASPQFVVAEHYNSVIFLKHVFWESHTHKWQRRPNLPHAWNDGSDVTHKSCFKLGDLEEIKRLFCLGNKGFGQLFSAVFKFLKFAGV